MSTIKAQSWAAQHLKPVQVPDFLCQGDKFIKWDEDSGVGTPVTLRVDNNGFYLYWVDQNKEMDLLDISTIRDSRTGKQAKIPKEPKLRQIVTMGSQGTLEEKTVTLCCGPDFVNLSFINFCCTKKEIAQLWTEALLKLAFSLSQLNGSVMTFLNKAHTKLILTVDKAGKIPIKNIVKMFAQNKEDRKRVKNALDATGFPSGKDETISAQKFTFEEFFNFYKNLTQRTEVEKVFEEMCGSGSKRKMVSAGGLVEFLNKTQRDPRLNEILHPYADEARARDLIAQYEPRGSKSSGDGLSLDGFLAYLLSADNPVVAPPRLDLSDDMDQPLAHYFINSSHNTYLTGHQLTGKSSVEMYRQCLLAGCRCVELDFWNGGRTEEPVIVHGYTFVPEISAKEVIEAIAESAFKTSEFPVVLSFENHCNPRQQAKIAQYCRDSFGEMLLDQPLDSHQLESGVPLPPPSMLKRKIIIKNKKKQGVSGGVVIGKGEENGDIVVVGGVQQPQATPQVVRQPSRESNPDEEENDDEEVESWSGGEDEEKPAAAVDKGEKAKETEAGAEISALVNYVQPVHFASFENSEKKNRTYEMSSFDEKQATMLLKERPIEFVKYNKRQLSRVYPAGTRFDSSNFMPQVFWNAGCQLVALNYQTLDLAMQLNLGIFEYNHRCGYLLKPEFMRRPDRRFDPFAESTVDGIIAGSVSIHVLSAQFLTDKRCGTYVEVDMYGLPADTVRKKFRTRIIQNNAINPIYDEEPFVFKKVVLPELACIRIAAYEEGGRFIGHRVLPVVGLCPGYRHVSLRTESGQPLPLATLFLHIVVKDYVPDGLSDFAEALANPIKYQSELEKRAQQLAVLTDDLDIDDGGGSEETSIGSASRKRVGSTSELGARGSIAGVVVSSGGGLVGGLPPTLEETTPQPPPPLIESSPPPPSLPPPLLPLLPLSSAAATALTPLPPQSLQIVAPPASAVASLNDDIAPETLEKLLDAKPVKEKRAELEKKLEALRKKHDKEKSRVQSSQDGDKPRAKFYISNKLVKRLSSKNMEVTSSEEGEVTEGGEGIPRSQSERLLAVYKDHLNQEKDIHDKYHELVFASAHKVMAASQSTQLKTLHSLLERETSDVMRRLQAARRQEVKALAKNHRDRDELVRMKREVASSMVEKGVHERVRLTELYEKKREELERQHNEVRAQLAEEKAKAKAALEREYEGRAVRAEEQVEGKR